MTTYAFILAVSVTSFVLNWELARRMERRIIQRFDQVATGVRIDGHPAARRQVARRQSQPAVRPVQVD